MFFLLKSASRLMVVEGWKPTLKNPINIGDDEKSCLKLIFYNVEFCMCVTVTNCKLFGSYALHKIAYPPPPLPPTSCKHWAFPRKVSILFRIMITKPAAVTFFFLLNTFNIGGLHVAFLRLPNLPVKNVSFGRLWRRKTLSLPRNRTIFARISWII